MILSVLYLIGGFALLIKGADALVDGASSIAKKSGVSNLVIGLTVVAFGTSMPELVVGVSSVLQGSTDIAIGNVVGSTIANTLLILGLSAIIYPLTVKQSTVWKEIPFSLLAAFLLGVMANDVLIDGVNYSALTRSDALTLLAFFIVFLYYSFGIAKDDGSDEGEEVRVFSGGVSWGMIVLGIGALVLGGQGVVTGASSIAQNLGMSEVLIGFTIVAVGTSLPELVTSAVAAMKKKSDIAIGNVVGSNIFNTFLILGVSGMIRPIPFDRILNLDLLVAFFATLALFLALFVGKKHTLERWQGGLFVVVYFFYIAALVMRG